MGKDVVLSERVDRNGTKHQVIETNCDRCGGAGGSIKWKFTGITCYKCGGSGRMTAKNKIYTPEHALKLEKQREKRRLKKEAEIREQAIERNKEYLENCGYAQEKIYVVLGDTYKIKDELKEKGARFNSQVSSWFFTSPTDEYETFELETSKLLKYDNLGQVAIHYDSAVSEYIKSVRQAKIDENKKVYGESQYVGSIGDKIEIELEVEKTFWVEFDNPYAYGSMSTCFNIMRDSGGNIFVWKTGRNLEHDVDENGKVVLKGTIKEYSEYKGDKQTILTRCRVQKGK